MFAGFLVKIHPISDELVVREDFLESTFIKIEIIQKNFVSILKELTLLV
jgi:hypothetical protein